jgi:hypothetical protein
LKFLSVNSIVIPPAKTGRDKISNKAVTNTDHTYKGILKIFIPGTRIFITVVIKFIEPNMDEKPAKCKLKIAKSTETPE